MKKFDHSTGTFIGKSGVEIFFQVWNVPNPKGLLVIAHGLGEHSSRYDNLINALDGKGISVYALDHRGFGRSGGKKGHVDSFMDYIYDLKIFVNMIKDRQPGKPLTLLGHSMGGVVACKYALTHPADLDALVLSGPAFMASVKVPAWKSKLAGFLSSKMPSLSMSSGLDSNAISRDKDVVRTYDEDPLVHDKVTPRFFTEFMNTAEECLNRVSELKMPLLLFHGTEDQLADFNSSKITYERAQSKDKELYLFENLYHETMNEPEKDRKKVLDQVSKWIVKHATGKKKGASKKAAGKKSTAKKATGKKTAKKTVKKTVKKSAPKSTKKAPAKKAAKKTAGKTAKKTTKKTTKKAPAKKATGKSTKKSAKKSAKKSTKKTTKK